MTGARGMYRTNLENYTFIQKKRNSAKNKEFPKIY